MSQNLTEIISILKKKDETIASDFIVSHKLLERIWMIHHKIGRFYDQEKEATLFIPVNLYVLPYYLEVSIGGKVNTNTLLKKLQNNIDYKNLAGALEEKTFDWIFSFVRYYYREYIFSLDDEVSVNEIYKILEPLQQEYLDTYWVKLFWKKYKEYKWYAIPTLESLKILLRKLYDHGGIKCVQDYLDSPYLHTDSESIKTFIETHFEFRNKRWYRWKIESSYQSIFLHGDGSVIINKPYIGYARNKLKKDSRPFILLKDLLRAYPKPIPYSHKYSKVFWFTRNDKTGFRTKVEKWRQRVESQILGDNYPKENNLLSIENATISIREI